MIGLTWSILPYEDDRSPGSGLALQRALELVEMVVVVPRHERDEVVDRDGAARGVDTGALPLLGRESAEQRERLVATRAEGRQRQRRVVPEVLTLLGPAIRRGGIERELRVVHRQDHPEPAHEHLLDVAQVADGLLRRPVLAVRAARQRRIVAAPDRGGELVGGAGQTLHTF